mmetsp:Transcript_250/g.866  ORF Transcript_250/g.866 Transcript_250/m.866 type:complete len:659 (-) Transcript_250:88-2064(-)
MALGISWKGYVGVSTAAFAVAVGNAMASAYEHGQTEEETAEVMLEMLFASKLSICILANMALCCLFLVGKLVQYVFFGRLRESETQHMYDRMVNYVLFKVIFLSAIFEPSIAQVILLASWFALLGFLKLFAQLSRDRFEYLMTSANTHMAEHRKLIILLVSILTIDVVWFFFSLSSVERPSYSTFFLLTFECFTLFLDTLQTLIKYGIHLARPDGNWENRGTYVYYTEFVTDSLILTATLAHYCHILYMHGFSFTLIDAVLFLNMRIVFNNLREKVAAYRNYRKLAHAMNVRFPSMTPEELEQLDDDCAICRERMDTAKRLPCKHVFHENCLRLWLEQHHSCPTCRCSLIEDDEVPAPPHGHPAADPRAAAQQQPRADQQPVFAALLGGRGRAGGAPAPDWLHWLPGVGQQPVTPLMIEQVQMVLPHAPPAIIQADLQRTGSVELTIANILEGRVEMPEAPEPPLPPSPERSPARPSPVVVPPQEEEIQAPGKGFASSAEERAARLAARKAALVQQARKRLLAEKARKAKEAAAQAEAANSPTLQRHDSAQAPAQAPAPSPAATAANEQKRETLQPAVRAPRSPARDGQRQAAEQALAATAAEAGKRSPVPESLEARRRKLALAAERRMRQSAPTPLFPDVSAGLQGSDGVRQRPSEV